VRKQALLRWAWSDFSAMELIGYALPNTVAEAFHTTEDGPTATPRRSVHRS
jgi:hypothetical protein